ncbi:MAG: hypothetical protein NC489_31675 [Ruminococcus flavefaciens]|nr:hypothetical protein [Ruminococcus flavefaciens]
MPVFYSDKHIKILLDAGEKIEAGKAFGDVESIKTVSDLIDFYNVP